jgi:4-hydroxy-tetrahydrodipicolinate reductase
MAQPPLKLAIAGAGGRMGRMLLDVARADPTTEVQLALEHAQSPLVGTSVGSYLVTADVAALKNVDCIIDFTRPAGTLAHLEVCAQHGVAAVIGTTGFDAEQLAQLKGYAQRMPVVFAPNMSLGVNVTAKLVEQAAKALGLSADIEVFEAHHKLKVDAPSGTALMLGRVAAEARGQRIDEVSVFDRHGADAARTSDSIGFSSMRGGDIVGDHTVFFALNGERIEITHRSASRSTYAEGALRAAKWLVGRGPGLFDMRDVLGLRAPA